MSTCSFCLFFHLCHALTVSILSMSCFYYFLIYFRGRNDLPSPTAVCSDPLTRLSVPTHNAHPRSLAALRQSTGHSHPFASYGQESGYDKNVKLVAVRRLRIINMMIGKSRHGIGVVCRLILFSLGLCECVCMYCMYRWMDGDTCARTRCVHEYMDASIYACVHERTYLRTH